MFEYQIWELSIRQSSVESLVRFKEGVRDYIRDLNPPTKFANLTYRIGESSHPQKSCQLISTTQNREIEPISDSIHRYKDWRCYGFAAEPRVWYIE